jgi:hypothetical protein
MQAFNLGQLQASPAAVLQAAHEDDLVVVMDHDAPQAVLVDLDKFALSGLDLVKFALAVALFKQGILSIGSAARIADRALPDMLTLFSSLNIPVTGNQAEEAVLDMAAARDWLRQSR